MAKPEDIALQSSKDFEETLTSLNTNNSKPVSGLEELEQIVNEMLSTLPRINRNAIRKEMEEMHVNLQQNPHTSDLNEGLAKAQGYKDRLAEIYTLALREFKLRSRCVDMLFDANNVVSKGKSADVRRGEATMRYPMLLVQLEAAESFMKEVEHVLQNIKSAHESVSRQVSVAQIQLQLGEIRREAPKSSQPREAEEIRKSGETDWDNF